MAARATGTLVLPECEVQSGERRLKKHQCKEGAVRRALSARLGSLHLTEWMHRSSDSRNSRVMWSDLRPRRIVLVVGLEGDKQDEPLGVCLGVSVREMSCEQCLMNKCASE